LGPELERYKDGLVFVYLVHLLIDNPKLADSRDRGGVWSSEW